MYYYSLQIKNGIQNKKKTYVVVIVVVSFLLAFPPITSAFLFSPIRAIFPAHAILLDLIILVVLDEL
jgi:hypothetical protein